MLSDRRQSLGPPDRAAMALVPCRSRQISQAVPPTLVPCVDNKMIMRRRASIFSVVTPEPSARGQEASGTGGRSSTSWPTPGLFIYDASSQERRPSCVTQPSSVQVPGKIRRPSAVIRSPYFPPTPEHDSNSILPLADAIAKGNSSEKELLVFQEADRNQFEKPCLAVPSLEVNGPASLMKTSLRSETSPSDQDSRGPGSWKLRWCLDKVGRLSGQIRCVKDLCVLRSGSIVATESKNARLQVFSKSGKSLAVLGQDSDSSRTSKSFGYPLSMRKMQPAGVTETVLDNIVAVTDLNRVLYIEAVADGELEAEVLLKGKTDLRGIVTTPSSKIIVTEVGSQASVGLYETSGKLIREYKGNFRKPCYVTFDPTYDLCAVSDSELGLVFLYDASGNLLRKFGSLGNNSNGGKSSAGHLVYPSGLSWSLHGRLLVADEVEKKVVGFDLRNLTAETILTEDDGLSQPVALASDFGDSRNRIYVAEEFYDFGVNKYYLKTFEQKPMDE